MSFKDEIEKFEEELEEKRLSAALIDYYSRNRFKITGSVLTIVLLVWMINSSLPAYARVGVVLMLFISNYLIGKYNGSLYGR